MIKKLLAAVLGLTLVAGNASAQNCAGSLPYTLTNGTNADATQVMANYTYLLNCINGLVIGGGGGLSPPQGRLTLVTATPVMTTNQTGKTTIYYTPYVGNQVLIYDGTNMISTTFAEISNVTTGSGAGAGPAAVVANSNYDLFVWSSGGTVTLTRGPPWTSDTARGAGTGTTELVRVNGIWMNAVNISNGPNASRGTYVGTVRSNGTSQIDFALGGTASGGTAAFIGVWNTYNRVDIAGLVADSTDSWNYTTPTVRAANNSTAMRVSWIQGLADEPWWARYDATAWNGTSTGVTGGVGVDTTSAFSGNFTNVLTLPGATATNGQHSVTLLGFHYLQALEWSNNTGTTSWAGDAGLPTITQTGLSYRGRY